MDPLCLTHGPACACRRDFLRAAGLAAGAIALGCRGPRVLPTAWSVAARRKEPAVVRGAFLYPPSEKLRGKGGWWSWPGKDFDAEGRQQRYMARLTEAAPGLGVRLAMEEKPIDASADLARFIAQVKDTKPDGLLLIPFKHSHFAHLNTLLKAVKIPTVIYSCLGVKHGSIKGYQRPGVYFIQALDDLGAIEYGLRMIATKKRMAQSRILSIGRTARDDYVVPDLGTEVRVRTIQRFVEEVDRTEVTDEVRALARSYMRGAKEIVEPREPEIVTAARVHFANRRLLAAEQADAIMIDCLRRGLYMPCMSFMTLRDQGIAAGCENDLSATLTLMLAQLLFDRPGFQGNPGYETERNHYFHSHCTSASKLFGVDAPAESYLLRDYPHTNDPTCCPQVLWRPGEDVTMAHYLGGKPPKMLVYSGKVVAWHAMPPVGGCRTNVEITINELRDAADVKGHHNVLFYGDHARRLRAFARLYGITVVT